MSPPRSYRPTPWITDVIAPDDIQRAATDTGCYSANPPATAIAANSVNKAIQEFITLGQDVDSAGELTEFFLRISKRVADLLAELRDEVAEYPYHQAMSAFSRFPDACERAGFDPMDIDDLASWLCSLQRATENIQPDSPGKRHRTDTPALAAGLNAAFNAVSGKTTGGYSVPTEGGQPTGPFIAFAAAILGLAADRLDAQPPPTFAASAVAAGAAELRAIAGNPGRLKALRQTRRPSR